MRRSQYVFGTALAAAMAMAGLQGVHAQDQKEHVSKAAVKSLAQVPLAGVAGKEVIIKHFAVPPGFVGERHLHPGPVFVYVLEGELTVETGGETLTFKAGELYSEAVDSVMQGKNLSTSDDLEFVVFQVGDIGKPMMIKAD